MRSLLPTLKEKKRYLAFEIISENPIKSFSEVSNQITNSYTKFFGEVGLAEAGIIVMKDNYNETSQKGIIKVNTNYLDKLKTALALTKEINRNKIIFKSLGASGILNKAVLLINTGNLKFPYIKKQKNKIKNEKQKVNN